MIVAERSRGSSAWSETLPRMLLLSAGVVLYLSFGNTEMAGSDLWWHLAAGRELVQTGTPWMVDSWSFTAAGSDWHNHEWLAGLIFYGWAETFGLVSLVYWKWLLVVATFLLLQLVLRRQTDNDLAAFIGAAVAIAIAAPFLDMRPHIYTLFNLCLLLLLALERQPSRPLLAVLFLLWVNLHGGFFFGLMALAVLLFPWRNYTASAFKTALTTGLLCVAACLLNPSGFKSFLFPLVYAFDSTSVFRGVGEWLSPFREGGIHAPLFFIFMWFPLAGVLYAIPAIRGRVSIPWEGILLTGLTLAMALTSRRFIPLFGISLAVMLAPLLALALNQVRSRALVLGLALVAVAAASLRIMPYSLKAAPSFHYLAAEYTYPEDTLDFVEQNGIQGNVYALYNWGGYLHWRTDGGLKVFIDGRADTVYSDEIYLAYGTVLNSREGWIDALEQTGAEYILWPDSRGYGESKFRQLQQSGRWQLLYRDAVSWLMARNPPQGPLKNPVDSSARQLTLAMEAARLGRDDLTLQHARAVRSEIPWQKRACQLETGMLMKQGQQDAAADVLLECLGYFPTRFLP
jgi:hypothetical protein